jgi:hypothetical protein
VFAALRRGLGELLVPICLVEHPNLTVRSDRRYRCREHIVVSPGQTDMTLVDTPLLGCLVVDGWCGDFSSTNIDFDTQRYSASPGGSTLWPSRVSRLLIPETDEGAGD